MMTRPRPPMLEAGSVDPTGEGVESGSSTATRTPSPWSSSSTTNGALACTTALVTTSLVSSSTTWVRCE